MQNRLSSSLGAIVLSFALQMRLASDEPKVLSDPALVASYSVVLQNAAIRPRVPEILDSLEGIKDKRAYIKAHELSVDDVVKRANAADVVLFGERHTADGHSTAELELLKRMEHNKLIYAYESFSLDSRKVIERYMNGDESAAADIKKGLGGDNLVTHLEFARRADIGLLVTDIGRNRKRELSHCGSDFYPRAVRDEITARAIRYARSKGYKVFGVFGDMHVQQSAIPSHLHAEKVLVISGSSFTRPVFEAAMDVSGGKPIYFERKSDILFVDRSIDWDGKYER